MRVFLNLLAGAVAVLLLIAILFPWGYAIPKEAAKRTACMSNLQ